jgi:hypothetical protein
MPKIQDLSEYMISPHELAAWLDDQPESWWTVDGDPSLAAKLDFPCPSSELADEIRRRNTPLHLLIPHQAPQPARPTITKSDLDGLSSTDNRYHERTFLLRWNGSTPEWLLMEYKRIQDQTK